jgi:O-antigen/teichoic acid export membrane protein
VVPLESASRLRNRRLKYAIVTSLGSKVSTAIIQIAALPLALAALGQQQFVLYAMLASAVGWLGLVNIGVGPPLTVMMSEAAAAGDHVQQQRLFSSAVLPVALLVLTTGIAVAIALRFISTDWLFGAAYAADRPAIVAGLLILTAVFLVQTLVAVVEAAQLGYQEQYRLNAMAIGGNLAAAIAIVGVATVKPTVVGLIAAISLPPLLFRVANAAHVIWHRPHLQPRAAAVSRDVTKRLVGSGVAFSLATGFGNFLCHQLPIVLMGKRLPSDEAASFAVTVNALLIAAGMVSMVTVSLWPAISDGMARGDRAWVEQASRRTLRYSIGYGLLVGAVFALFGRLLFRLWFGASIDVGPWLSVPLGLYFFLLMWENAYFAILIGMKEIAVPSFLYIGRSLFAVALMRILVERAGAPAAFIALAASVCLFTLLPFRARVRRVLADPGSFGT